MSRIFYLTSLVILVCAFVFPQGKKAADFHLKTVDGKSVELAQMKGKVVLLNFWATWCGPCIREIPDIKDVYKRYKQKGFEVVGVSVDEEGWSVVTPFVKRHKIDYPIVIGTGKLVQAYGSFEYVPTTFLIDKNGTIVHTFTGLITKAELERRLKEIL